MGSRGHDMSDFDSLGYTLLFYLLLKTIIVLPLHIGILQSGKIKWRWAQCAVGCSVEGSKFVASFLGKVHQRHEKTSEYHS